MVSEQMIHTVHVLQLILVLMNLAVVMNVIVRTV